MTLRRERPPAGWIEWGAWVMGLALILACACERLWSECARVEGIRLFQAAHAGPADEGPSVDQSLWSSQRVAAFARSSDTAGVPEGLLRIPSVALEVPVYEGATELNLDRGAAHIEGTAALAQGGNAGIAGHRDGFFRKLKDIRLDGEVELEVGTRRLRYRVVDIRIVEPTDEDVLAPTRIPTLTLVTCYPFYFVGNAPQRYIVRAELSTSKLASVPPTSQPAFPRTAN